MKTATNTFTIRIDSMGENKWGIKGQEIIDHKDSIEISKGHEFTEINPFKKYKISFRNTEGLLSNNKYALSGNTGDYINLKPNGYSKIIVKKDNGELKLVVYLQSWARVNFY